MVVAINEIYVIISVEKLRCMRRLTRFSRINYIWINALQNSGYMYIQMTV